MNNRLIVLLIEKNWIRQLSREIPNLYPQLPKPKIWEKHGQVRIYFNRKFSNGYDVTFYLEFPEDEVVIRQFNEKYWLGKLNHANLKEFEAALSKSWDNIIRSSLTEKIKSIDMDKVKVHEDPLLEKRCLECRRVFKAYKSERATFCSSCKKRL
jgi:hypothetical protein